LVSNAINSLIEERFNALEDRIAAVELHAMNFSGQEPKHTNIENINLLDGDDKLITLHLMYRLI